MISINKLQKLEASLPLLQTLDGFAKPYSFIVDGLLQISSENGDHAIDYYGEYRGGYPYIDPKLESWAAKRGGHWEWQNCSAIAFYK
jgi:hypothetical protein